MSQKFLDFNTSYNQQFREELISILGVTHTELIDIVISERIKENQEITLHLIHYNLYNGISIYLKISNIGHFEHVDIDEFNDEKHFTKRKENEYIFRRRKKSVDTYV